jgi:hypothetical protein
VRILPYERLTLLVESPPDVVAARLSALVATKWFYLTAPPEPFRGWVRGRHFTVVRHLGLWHNSSRPVVLGEIVPAPSGTVVRIRMRLAIVVAAFLVLWFGALLLFGGLLAWRALGGGNGLQGGSDGGAGLAVGAMVLIGYLLVSLSFWSEVRKARALLVEGLGAREAKARNPLVRAR